MTVLRKTPDAPMSRCRSVRDPCERASDVVAREALLDACFGANRHTRTCQRLRDGRAPAEGLALLGRARRAGWSGPCGCGTSAPGACRRWCSGPLAVDPSCRKLGVGAALMDHALAAARARGHGAVILLGDAPYYARFGFSALKTAELSLPGPFERDRLLGLELREGALDGAWGMIAPTGASARKPRLARAKSAAARATGGLSPRPCPRLPAPREAARSRVRGTITHDPADHARRHDRQGHIGAPVELCARAASRRDTAFALISRGCAHRAKSP